jgi:hypothetical protein
MLLPDTTHTQPFLDATLALAGIGVFIGSLEDLVCRNAFSDHGLMSWQVSRTDHRSLLDDGPAARVFAHLLTLPGFQWVVAARLAAISLLLTFQFSGWERSVLLGVVLTCGLAYNIRCPYGLSGDHQMTVIVMLALFLASLSPGGRLVHVICLWFIALQGVLSYAVAGVSKLSSPTWRSGEAIPGILRTTAYGNGTLFQIVAGRPAIAMAAAWGTILFESLFLLVFLRPMPVRIGFLAAGVLFHLQIACVMGLNLFFWAFVSTYPAILFCAMSS